MLLFTTLPPSTPPPNEDIMHYLKGSIFLFTFSNSNSRIYYKRKQYQSTKCLFGKLSAQQKQWSIPWFTNSDGLLEELAWATTAWLVRLVEDILPCDWTALLSISCVLVVQKSSDVLGLSTALPCFVNPVDGTSTVTSAGLL